MVKNFKSERYKIQEFKKADLEGRFLIDLETKSIVTITSISNLDSIAKKGKIKQKTPHYAQTMVNRFNNKFNSYQQLQFNGFDKFDFGSDLHENQLKNLLKGIDIDLDDFTYYIVAYDFNSDKVIEMYWYLYNANFQIVEKEDMMKYVKPDFIYLTNSSDVTEKLYDSVDTQRQPTKRIKLGLKKGVQRKKG